MTGSPLLGRPTIGHLDPSFIDLMDDVKALLRPVLTHRLILRPESQMRGITLEDGRLT